MNGFEKIIQEIASWEAIKVWAPDEICKEAANIYGAMVSLKELDASAKYTQVSIVLTNVLSTETKDVKKELAAWERYFGKDLKLDLSKLTPSLAERIKQAKSTEPGDVKRVGSETAGMPSTTASEAGSIQPTKRLRKSKLFQ